MQDSLVLLLCMTCISAIVRFVWLHNTVLICEELQASSLTRNLFGKVYTQVHEQ
jgi:hypothetical protein